jgi:hypothetical protein
MSEQPPKKLIPLEESLARLKRSMDQKKSEEERKDLLYGVQDPKDPSVRVRPPRDLSPEELAEWVMQKRREGIK